MAQQKPEQPNQSRDDYRHRRHRHDKGGAIFAGVILIVLGLLFYLTSQGILAWGSWWQVFLIGIGVILLVMGLIGYRSEDVRRFRVGQIIGGIILIGVGASFMLGAVPWLILIAVGIAVIVGALLRSGDPI